MQLIFVRAVQSLAVGVHKAERIERIFDEVAAHRKERPGSTVRVVSPVATEVAGHLPAVDHLAHLRFTVANCLMAGGDTLLDGLARCGLDGIVFEWMDRFDS